MAIFGTGEPVWVYDRGGVNEYSIVFYNAYDINFQPNTVYIEHESEIDLERDFIFRGSHYTLDFKINLYKRTNPLADFNYIIAKKGLKGSVYLHNGGKLLKKSDNTDALFILKDVVPFYLETVQWRDGLYITLESCSPVDLSK